MSNDQLLAIVVTIYVAKAARPHTAAILAIIYALIYAVALFARVFA